MREGCSLTVPKQKSDKHQHDVMPICESLIDFVVNGNIPHFALSSQLHAQ
jgi:hypothetical protein